MIGFVLFIGSVALSAQTQQSCQPVRSRFAMDKTPWIPNKKTTKTDLKRILEIMGVVPPNDYDAKDPRKLVTETHTQFMSLLLPASAAEEHTEDTGSASAAAAVEPVVKDAGSASALLW